MNPVVLIGVGAVLSSPENQSMALYEVIKDGSLLGLFRDPVHGIKKLPV
jgi:hypothetical protein